MGIRMKLPSYVYGGVCVLMSTEKVEIKGDASKCELLFGDTKGEYRLNPGTKSLTVPLMCGLGSADEIEAYDCPDAPDLPPFLKVLPSSEDIKDFVNLKDEKHMRALMKTGGMSDKTIDESIKLIQKNLNIPAFTGQGVTQNGKVTTPKKGSGGLVAADGSKKFPIGAASDKIIKDFHVKFFKDGFIRGYRDGVYEMIDLINDSECVKMFPDSRQSERNEVLKQIMIKVKQRDFLKKYVPDKKYICFLPDDKGRCMLNLETGELEEPSPDKIVFNRIPHQYKKNAPIVDIVDKHFNDITCNDKEVRELLLQFIGYVMWGASAPATQKAFILKGEGSNGKSTFLEMLENDLLGTWNTAALQLDDFSKQFRVIELVNKLINVGDDISDRFQEESSNFKIITGQGRLMVERKYQDAINYQPRAKLIFSANKIPRIKDQTQAIISRLIIIPFDAEFMRGTAASNQNMGELLAEEPAQEYIVRLAVEALYRFRKGGKSGPEKFDIPQRVQAEIDAYSVENNPVLGFIDEYKTDIATTVRTLSGVYELYKTYCEDDGIKPLGKNNFNNILEKHSKVYFKKKLKRTKKNGERIWVFEDEEGDE